ncbi:hypothetical protein ES703_59603 [subsurface metagenome]
MMSEQQASKELMVRGWGFGHFEELDRINAALKEAGILPGQALQLIEAITELKDTDFRTAAFSLLELKKKTGKSYKEAEIYIQGLEVKMESKKEQSSDWTSKAEKAKGEFTAWEQKRNDENASFNFAQAQNKCNLKEDAEKLSRELTKNNVLRANIKWTIWLIAELKKIGMDLSTFVSIVREIVSKGGINSHVAEDIKEAVKTFGSLGKAIVGREREDKAKKKAMNKEEKARKATIFDLSQEEECFKEIVKDLSGRSELLTQDIRNYNEQIDLRRKSFREWEERINQNKWQWECFQVFISMLLASPSAPDSLAPIALKLQELEQQGWKHYGGLTLPQQRRALFIFLVMGTYLHSVYCSNCKASFIVNKVHNAYAQWRSSYYCPVCDLSLYTKPDDTFLNLMVSPKLSHQLQEARTLLDTMGKTDWEALGKKLTGEGIKWVKDGTD